MWRLIRPYGFTIAIAASVAVALIWPDAALHAAGFDLRNKWLFLFAIQAVMFGMGIQMRIEDFAGVAKAPRGVMIGLVCHYSIMPLVGFLLARVFRFPPEVAAGMILVGSCSSGLASNVMAYIARSNLALSVTVTALSTMVSPLMTPLLMKLLARTWVSVSFLGMAAEISKIVLVPIGGALLCDALRRTTPENRRRARGAAILCAAWVVFLAARRLSHAPRWSPAANGAALAAAFVAEGVMLGVGYEAVFRAWPGIERAMPVLSMVGIVYATDITAAAGRENLLKIGVALAIATAMHNGAGYLFGYGLARGAGLDRNSARSVAFEVGMQNGGMASGLAAAMGKLATVGLAAAVFSPIMNVSGSLLAQYWRRRPV